MRRWPPRWCRRQTRCAPSIVARSAVEHVGARSAVERVVANAAGDISTAGMLTISDVDGRRHLRGAGRHRRQLRHLRHRCRRRLDLHRQLGARERQRGHLSHVDGALQAVGGDMIVDFDGQGAAAGNSLQFVGYGPGATFTQNDATHWQIDYNGGSSHELITFMNGAAIHASDWHFV